MSEENFCLLQGYEWNVPADQKHYTRLTNVLQDLKDIGIDNLWLPPACKGAEGPKANGFDIYDLYDLGEFDQKGGKPTKWGSKEELVALSKKAEELGVGLYFDAVLNHKAGADEKEKCKIQEVDEDDRNKDIGEPREIDAWLKFNFPGRNGKYSKMTWNWEHFSGTDYDAGNDKHGIFRILGENKYWSQSVGSNWGNADFLMFADIDYSHPEVIEDTVNWGIWVVKELNLKGFRLDACQHYSARFMNEWATALEKEFGKDKIFLVGEFWSPKVEPMIEYLDRMKHKFALYDSPLVYNFSRLSTGEDKDLRKVFDGSLASERPADAVTVVTNHDTQPGQTIETKMEDFFKPLGYSLILLRKEGYPCVFYGDFYGTKGEQAESPACGGQLGDFVLARKLYAYGDQEDYFDKPECIGFVRRGTEKHAAGLACVMSIADDSEIKMTVGTEHKGEIWTDVLNWRKDEVKIDENGQGVFPCPGKSVSIWVKKDAAGRDKFGKFNSKIYETAK